MKNARDEIRAWLRDKPMRQREFAPRIGITHEQLSRILGGTTPSLPVRKLIAIETGLNVEDASSWT